MGAIGRCNAPVAQTRKGLQTKRAAHDSWSAFLFKNRIHRRPVTYALSVFHLVFVILNIHHHAKVFFCLVC